MNKRHTSLGILPAYLIEEYRKADTLPTDQQRQHAYCALDQKVRKAMKVPVDKFYSINTRNWELTVDNARNRKL